MYNPFVGLKEAYEVERTGGQVAPRLSDGDRKERRDALYAMYTPMVYAVLDQMIAAFRPGTWITGSDRDHPYCCHCRWYAGPEETGRAHYGDHPVRRKIEIELEIDDQCGPTGFIIWNHANSGTCAHVGLSQDELVGGIKAVLH